ncbi:MAG TPA: polysaccharide deacetylase family protein [Pyrinomonadaceae bacterium]|jgi:peptidoglycan/xylan/chitin deacetylase (PgdA/CDA1 family)|nr:polysaccharide deacetylase family protein [Pyrinomonadaceae bacterium]
MNIAKLKLAIAKAFDVAGINALGHFIQRKTLSPFIRAVNYHEINRPWVESFEKHVEFYSTRFVNVTYEDLTGFLDTGKWPHDKPGLIITFDDGSTTHLETAAPILEKYGFTGWFFVPSGWVIEKHGVKGEKPWFVKEIEVLTHEQLKRLDEKHIIGCHTDTHCRLSADVPAEKMRDEILGAQKEMEELLGHPVRLFSWTGGEESAYSKTAADLVKEGFDLSFMTNSEVIRPGINPLQIQRTNVEAEHPLSLVRFQLSGIMDIAYAGKRKRVNKLTK